MKYEFEITYYKKQYVEAGSLEEARNMLIDLLSPEYVVSDGKPTPPQEEKGTNE